MQISKKVIFSSIFLVAVVGIVGIVIGGQSGHPKSQPYWYQAHEGECMDAARFKNIDRVILFLDIDPVFEDVPDLKSVAAANTFSVEKPFLYHPSPFIQCLNKTGMKTSVIYAPGSSYGPNDLVVHVKLTRQGKDTPNSDEYMKVAFQIIWPTSEVEWLTASRYRDFRHSSGMIMEFVDHTIANYLLQRMGYVEPIQREGHYNVH